MAASPGKMYSAAVYILIFCMSGFLVAAKEKFIITHVPSYLHTTNDASSLKLSEVSNLILSSYGYSLSKNIGWDSLKSKSLFKRPKANVILTVDGLGQAKNDVPLNKMASYPLEIDDHNVDTQSVADKLRSTNEAPFIVDFSSKSIYDIKAEHPDIFSKVSSNMDDLDSLQVPRDLKLNHYKLGSLNMSSDVDKILLGEVHVTHQMINEIKKNPNAARDKSPDLFHFHFGGLKAIMSSYGVDSVQAEDAVALVSSFLNKIKDEFKLLYGDNIIVQVITIPINKQDFTIRKTRNILATDDEDEKLNPLNLASKRDVNYAVVFNIILWLGIVIGVSLIMISYGMWNMDPGRDSIIYRMTTQRIKKD